MAAQNKKKSNPTGRIVSIVIILIIWLVGVMQDTEMSPAGRASGIRALVIVGIAVLAAVVIAGAVIKSAQRQNARTKGRPQGLQQTSDLQARAALSRTMAAKTGRNVLPPTPNVAQALIRERSDTTPFEEGAPPLGFGGVDCMEEEWAAIRAGRKRPNSFDV